MIVMEMLVVDILDIHMAQQRGPGDILRSSWAVGTADIVRQPQMDSSPQTIIKKTRQLKISILTLSGL